MKRGRVLIVVAILAAVIITVLGTGYGWVLGQIIFQSTYDAKAGGIDFWATWTLKNNIFTASLLLTILSMITLPQRSTFLSFLSGLAQTGAIPRRLELRSAIAWRVLQFGGLFVYYVATGGYSVTGQNVAFLMMLMGDGSISISSGELTTLFALPFSPGTSASSIVSIVPAMEAYQLYMGLISTFLLFTAGRVALSVVTDLMTARRDMFVVISKGLFVVSLALVLEIHEPLFRREIEADFRHFLVKRFPEKHRRNMGKEPIYFVRLQAAALKHSGKKTSRRGNDVFSEQIDVLKQVEIPFSRRLDRIRLRRSPALKGTILCKVCSLYRRHSLGQLQRLLSLCP